MLKYISTIIFCAAALNVSAQVGIKTDSPTRMLDVNGNLRISTLQDKSQQSGFTELVVANANNNIDKITKPALVDDGTKQVEIVKKIYNATGADSSKETTCGLLSFRLNTVSGNVITEVKFRDPIKNDINLTYGARRWGQTASNISNGYSYRNLMLSFKEDSYSIYQNLDANFVLRDGAFLNYHFIIPGDGDLYRLTVSRMKNDATNSNFSLICERFYNNDTLR